MPPALRVGPAGERPERVALLLVGDAIEGEQVGDVAVLEAHPSGLETAYLRVRRADDLSGLLERDPLRLAQPPELGPEQDAKYGGTAAARRIEQAADRVTLLPGC